MIFQHLYLIVFFLSLISSCERDVSFEKEKSTEIETLKYKTENVIVVVVDGPRFSETVGDSTFQYIPHLKNDLLPEGSIFTNFYNNGPTYTNAGYSSLTTGTYQEIDNSGNQIPENPSVFQYFLKARKTVQSKAWLIASKGKLKILSDCSRSEWNGKYTPSFNCGEDGNGNGTRNDSITLRVAMEKLKQYHPSIAVIGFKEPDITAHSGDWNGYLHEIKNTDKYVFQLWNFIQSDSIYRGKTAFFVTNDHGRHSDGVNDGFISHGDNCEGCRHINFFAAGPDFLRNKIVETQYELKDISATIAELLGFEMPTGKGKTIRDIFK